jgi:RNA processing factor Prp31
MRIMKFLEKYFPGVSAESESDAQEAQKLALELKNLRIRRANVAMYADDPDSRVVGDASVIEDLDKKIAETAARLKELGFEIPSTNLDPNENRN